jgi:predicted HTH transcriptional regulator
MLFDYISTDSLLGRFFDPFIFEKLPAKSAKPDAAYLEQVKHSDIYLGIFGKKYGFEDKNGISPTEHEFNAALKENKTKLIFITTDPNNTRNKKELALIKRAEKNVVRKKFSSPSELKTAVYAALVNYLEEKEFIRTGPFDGTVYKGATLVDLDVDRIKWFVQIAKSKRNFPLSPDANPEDILTHLNLVKEEGLTNAALLLFGKKSQKYFITSEVRCALFHGNEVMKPIPSYQVYKGDVFQLVDQAVDFVLSRINLSVGDRSRSVDVPMSYEIPRTAVVEAIVNAVAHRDYNSNGSVQVMLFRNRLEIWNPGHLPSVLPISKLKLPHASYPTNPLIAEPLYLAGYIERMGTGIPDMVKACIKAGLKEPELKQEEAFVAILWRKDSVTPHVTDQATDQVTDQATDQVQRLIIIIDGDMTRRQLMDKLDLRHGQTFRENYLHPALEGEWIEMTITEKPNDPNQKYRLTAKGKTFQQQLKKNKKE